MVIGDFKVDYKIWACNICEYVYNEELGDEEHGLPPGTRWEDIPDDWICPDCEVGKDHFEMREVQS